MKLDEVMQVIPVNQMPAAKIARQIAYNVSQSFVPNDWEPAAQKALQRFMGQMQMEIKAELQRLNAKVVR